MSFNGGRHTSITVDCHSLLKLVNLQKKTRSVIVKFRQETFTFLKTELGHAHVEKKE